VEVMEAIRSRRSIRKFKDEPVPADVLSRLEEAFVRSPSASNAQEGHMVLVSDGEQVRRVERFAPGLSGKPPALIVLCCNQEVALEGGGQEGAELLRYMNVGFSAAEIILAAHASGLGTCPVRSFHQGAVQRLLELPPEVVPELIITLGVPAETPGPKPMLPIEGRISYDRYGQH